MNDENSVPMDGGDRALGPYRELAKTSLARIVQSKKEELVGLEQLLKIAEKTENGSPLEYILWKIVEGRDFCR